MNPTKIISIITILFLVPAAFSAQPTKRDFSSNGTVTLWYPNGNQLQITADGTETWTYPDGSGSRDSGSHAPEPEPPVLPEAKMNRWAENVADTLLWSIESLFADNKKAFDRYKQFEGNQPLTGKIKSRARLLYKLTKDH